MHRIITLLLFTMISSLMSLVVYSQGTIDLGEISQATFTNNADWKVERVTGDFVPVLLVGKWRAPGPGLWAQNANFRDNAQSLNIPANAVNIRFINLTGLGALNLLTFGTAQSYALSTTETPFFIPSDLLSIPLLGGSILIEYSLNKSISNGLALVAGNYTNLLLRNYLQSGSNHYISGPTSWNLNFKVPEINKCAATATAYEKTYQSLSDFTGSATELGFDITDLKITHTIPTNIDIKLTTPVYFKPQGQTISAEISAPVNALISPSTSGLRNTPFALSTTYQELNLSSTAVQVPTGNNTAIPLHLKIPKEHLYQAGEYTFGVTVRTRKGATTSEELSMTFKIITNQLTQISLPSNDPVTFSFASLSDYQTIKAVTGHLIVSANAAYNVTVLSDLSFIPKNSVLGLPSFSASLIKVVEDGTSNTPKSLGSASAQVVHSGTTALNKDVPIKYMIPAGAALNLVEFPVGTYQANVTYNISAQ